MSEVVFFVGGRTELPGFEEGCRYLQVLRRWFVPVAVLVVFYVGIEKRIG